MVECYAVANGRVMEGRIDLFMVLAWWGWQWCR